MLKNVLQELIAIRKELQDIKLILKFHLLRNYKTESEIVDGERIVIRTVLPDPLEELHKEENTLQQCRKNGECSSVVSRRKLSRKN